MSFLTDIREKYLDQKDLITNENATINTLILPLFQWLGWDFSNLKEVQPQYGAAIGKKAEKVDYAFIRNDLPCLLVECKNHTEKLQSHINQVFQYYAASKAPLAVLTNGVEYWFFADTEETNIMDNKPFFKFNILDYEEKDIVLLKMFAKEAIDPEIIKNEAQRLKYQASVKDFLQEQYKNPCDDFIRFAIKKASHSSKAPTMTAKTIESMRPIVQQAIHDFISENVSIKLPVTEKHPVVLPAASTDAENAYQIVREIIAKVLPLDQVTMKENETYYGVLYQGKTTKWICRLYLGPGQMYVGVYDNSCVNNNRKIKIQTIEEIWNKSDDIIASAERLK